MNDINELVRRQIETGDPAADGRAFRRCLGQYPTGVTVVTARHGDKLLGMAVNSFAAVSLDPPLVLWSIRRESKSASDFLEASHFAVNVLASEQVEVSQRFGSGHPDRFSLTPCRVGQHGAPLIDGAIAHLECRRTVVHDGGDHLILIGQVERYSRYEGEPLVFAQGQYAVARNHPQLGMNGAPDAGTLPTEKAEPAFLKMLSVTSQHMSALFQVHRLDLGVTSSSTRILSRLYEGICSQSELEKATYLGGLAIEDELGELMASGDIRRVNDGGFELTSSGYQKSEAVARRSAEFSEQELQGIPDTDIAAAKRVFQILQTR
jgi:flavin reductase (DIM6/NTAB) family NADH-FMN oxidoreductase RutF